MPDNNVVNTQANNEDTIMTYVCPACGGNLEFDPKTQKLKCPYCESEYSLEDFDTHSEQNNTFSPSDMGYTKEELAGLKIYQCQACGAELMGDSTLGSTACPYCGNTIVLKGAFAGADRPDYIIPFKLDRKAAKQKYLEHLEGKKFLPRMFKEKNTIDKLQGLYVPFWLFDGKATMAARYRGTIVTTWEDSKYRYTKTDTFSVIREGVISYEDIPADAAKKLEDDLMDSIEPFDFKKDKKEFNTAFLAGFTSDKYDVSSEENTPRVNRRVRETSFKRLGSTVRGYTSVTPETKDIDIKNGKAKYVLLPVWIMSTTYNGEKFRFAMNGETGKFVGNLPCDKGLYWAYFGKTFGTMFAIFAVVLNVIAWFFL